MNTQFTSTAREDTPFSNEAALEKRSLTPDFEWSTALVRTLSRADYLLGKLAQEMNHLSPLFISSLLLREAVASARLEGSRATLREIFLNNTGAYTPLYPWEVKQIENYEKALTYGIEQLKEESISLPLLQKVQHVLEQDIAIPQGDPRKLRTNLRVIASVASLLSKPHHKPLSQESFSESLEKLQLLFQDKLLPPLIQSALCYSHCVTLAPSLGISPQVGRLLLNLALVDRKVLPFPLLSLSPYFEATRETYDWPLDPSHRKGSLTEWLIYFINGVATQTEDTLDRLQRLSDLLSAWQTQLTRAGTSVTRSIVQNLVKNPFLLTSNVARDLGVNYTTAQKAIHKLEAADVLKKIHESKWGRIYYAEEVLSILERPAKVNADFL
ncbi:Fic family protein [Candidatus Odyssella thessalonicensis]|uniref:Fic family protein n=1 Tax=Candidatus Odyssella thessalonicensis TaxID=84647 RepID=UPI000225A9F9|nr:Fic/DOC family N-terminal domain-containing protein [Candidatus Odyssella thessalonicensis]